MEDENREELSKEEILSRSRKENKNGDEREIARWKWYPYCGIYGGLIAIIACMIVFYVKHADDVYFDTLQVILSTMIAPQLAFSAIVTKHKKSKIVAIVCAVVVAICAVGQWVIFGIEVAGTTF